ncbi:MAG TPA: cupin domain-containing protein [Candidatus Acidoferrales bacterium]|nr:cupin domain-containing protein [Candidatus Acidoferrales bacterium]
MMNRREAGKIFALAAGALVAGSAKAFAEKLPATAPGQSATHAGDSIGVDNLMSEPLEQMQNPEVRMLTLTLAPGSVSHPHEHTGPVFAYILEGTIENQVDPNPPKTYKPGDFFYEPAMHVHRQMKNLSDTETAKVLVFEVGEKGKTFTIST